MTIDIDVITGPAFLASALVNGDVSGLSDADMDVLRNFEDKELGNEWRVVDVARAPNGECKDPRFTWSYRLYGGDADGGDVLDYLIERVS